MTQTYAAEDFLPWRVVNNVPAPRNLEIPLHTYLSETRLLIGVDSKPA